MRNILTKLQLHSRMDAVMYAVHERRFDVPRPLTARPGSDGLAVLSATRHRDGVLPELLKGVGRACGGWRRPGKRATAEVRDLSQRLGVCSLSTQPATRSRIVEVLDRGAVLAG